MSEKITKDPEAIEKKVNAVVSGTTKTKKKSEIRKMTDSFLSEDVAKIRDYVFLDVLIPSIKKAISDIVVNGIDIILYGESGRSRRKGSASRVSYRSYYDDDRDTRDRRRDYGRPSARTGYEYDDIIFDNRGDAELVLRSLEDIIEQYDVASVGDFYDLANVPNSNYGVNKYGWTNLGRASVQRCPDGYYIRFPKAMPLN